MGLFRKSETEKRLNAARADLSGAQSKLSAIVAGEEKALLADGAVYKAWRADRDAAATDVEHQTQLIAVLEAGAEATRRHDADVALRGRISDARKAADELSARIQSEGRRIAAELRQLMRDAAVSTMNTMELNSILPEGEAPVPVADFLARDTAVLPRVDIRSEEVALWVRRDNGILVGDQDNVQPNDDGTGHFDANGGRFQCVKRRFRSTTFHPGIAGDHPGHLFARVRLPNFDAPGLSFDGSLMTIEAVAAMEVEPKRPPSGSRRTVETELTPLDPWPLPGMPSEAERAARTN